MCAPSPPPPPDYAGAATAQGAANLEAAMAGSRLNNPNVVGPYGSQTWTEGTNPEDRPTVTQTLTPEQQQLLDQRIRTQGQLGLLGEQGANALKGIIGGNLDLSGLPAMPGSGQETRAKVMKAMQARIDEDAGLRRDKSNSDLIASGIRPGTQAYSDAMFSIDRARNDALQQAEVAAGGEASREFGMDSQRRREALGELLTSRQTPLNEITALMSGSQVSNPFTTPGVAQNANVRPAPVFDAAMAEAGYNTDMYNANAAGRSGLFGGLAEIGGSILSAPSRPWWFSDRRLKTNIVRVGTHPLGIGIYEYDMFGVRQRGVMAQELALVKPSAVLRHATGFLMVDYGQLA